MVGTASTTSRLALPTCCVSETHQLHRISGVAFPGVHSVHRPVYSKPNINLERQKKKRFFPVCLGFLPRRSIYTTLLSSHFIILRILLAKPRTCSSQISDMSMGERARLRRQIYEQLGLWQVIPPARRRGMLAGIDNPLPFVHSLTWLTQRTVNVN